MSRILFILLFFCLFSTSLTVHAAEETDVYQIKAAYLYNFAKFITWPESSASDTNEPFVIGVLGPNKFNDSLNPLTAKTVSNRPIVIRQFGSSAEIESCQILYIEPTVKSTLIKDLRILSNKAIITVSDQEDFALQGGTIQFIEVRDRLRFIINKTTADKQNIKIGSQLLSLAIDVLEDK